MRLLRELSHEHVIACREVLMTTNNCYIITEYYPQGDLAALLTQKGTTDRMQDASLTRKHCPCWPESSADLPISTPRELCIGTSSPRIYSSWANTPK